MALAYAPWIAMVVCHCVAILSTFLRLGHRFHRRQLYWDDFWALIALLATVFIMVILLVILYAPLRYKSMSLQSFVYWVTYFMLPLETWASRISIQVTVVRLLPPGRTRLISKGACVAFVLIWIAVFIQKFFMCGFPMPAYPTCASKGATPILALVTNLLGIIWLIGWPAYILYRMKLPSVHRRLLLACFSSSILLAVVEVAHAVGFFRNDYMNMSVTGHLEVALSLFLCNVLVLVTYIYRIFRNPENRTYATDTEESTHRQCSPSCLCAKCASRMTNIPNVEPTSRRRSEMQNESRETRATHTLTTSEYTTGLYSSIGPLTTVHSGSVLTQNWGSEDQEWEQNSSSSPRNGQLELPSVNTPSVAIG